MPYADPERQRQYQREWMAKRRAEFLAGKFCVDCGGSESLEVDHIDARLKVSHRIWSWSQARRDKELAKCAVRCAPCHRAKTITHGERPVAEHGSITMYQYHKCRCPLCRACKAEENARRYA